MKQADFKDSTAYETAFELVDFMLIMERDLLKVNRPIYLAALKYVFDDLNYSVIRQTDRFVLKVERSPVPHIKVPDGYKMFSSIGVRNHYGKFEPLIVNKDIPADFVDVGASKECGCECGCSNSFCSNIRNYELINTPVSLDLPDGTIGSFTATYRKKIMKDGSLVTETRQPQKIYVNNVHTSTELVTATETLCKLEIEECGCIKKNAKNDHLIHEHSDAITVSYECGCPTVEFHENDANFYKISDDHSRIVFPAHFPYDDVLLRCYVNVKTKDLRIPTQARRAVMAGIKKTDALWNGSPGEQAKWNREFNAARTELLERVARLKLKDFYELVLGKFDVL